FPPPHTGLPPITTGLAFLPMTGVLVGTSTTVQARVIQHTGAKPLVLAGTTLGAIAMFLFTRLRRRADASSSAHPDLEAFRGDGRKSARSSALWPSRPPAVPRGRKTQAAPH